MRNFFIILLILASCSDDPEEISEITDPMAGTWRAAPWYCQAPSRCSMNPVLLDSYLEFDIVQQNTDSSFNIANIYWHIPSGTITGIGKAYKWDNKVILEFMTDPGEKFQFSGNYSNGKMEGIVIRDDGQIVFAYMTEVTIEKE
jgi:hypothetical protein